MKIKNTSPKAEKISCEEVAEALGAETISREEIIKRNQNEKNIPRMRLLEP